MRLTKNRHETGNLQRDEAVKKKRKMCEQGEERRDEKKMREDKREKKTR